MNRVNFKKRLKEIGITQKEFASVTGYGYSTVKGWKTIPLWVGVVLDCLDVLTQLGTIDTALKSLDGLHTKVQNSDISSVYMNDGRKHL